MGDKPMRGIYHAARDRAAGGAAYFFLRGFAFFLTSSTRSLGGVASIRRASSSSDMGGCSGLGWFALMVMGSVRRG